MTKNVVILSSSPRRGGNSDTLCDEFMRGAIEAGNKVEKIFLRDKTIRITLTSPTYKNKVALTKSLYLQSLQIAVWRVLKRHSAN